MDTSISSRITTFEYANSKGDKVKPFTPEGWADHFEEVTASLQPHLAHLGMTELASQKMGTWRLPKEAVAMLPDTIQQTRMAVIYGPSDTQHCYLTKEGDWLWFEIKYVQGRVFSADYRILDHDLWVKLFGQNRLIAETLLQRLEYNLQDAAEESRKRWMSLHDFSVRYENDRKRVERIPRHSK